MKTKVTKPNPKVKPKQTAVQTHFEANLVINKATLDHKGDWRCIAYDRLGVSSEVDKEGTKFFKDQNLMHRGHVNIHVKQFELAIGIPLAVTGILIVLVILSILICKQCTDYDVDPAKAEAEDKHMAEEVGPMKDPSMAIQPAASVVAVESKTASVMAVS